MEQHPRHVVIEASKKTDRHTDSIITILLTPPSGAEGLMREGMWSRPARVIRVT